MKIIRFAAGVGGAALLALASAAPPAGAQTTDDVTTTPSEQYEVQSGDTLGVIASAHNTDIASVLGWNPSITNPDLILVGQVIVLFDIEVAHPLELLVDRPEDSGDRYTVVRGDTLSGIAARLGVPLRDLFTLNTRPNPDLIHPGERLRIPTRD